MTPPLALDLFAGCGGLSTGLLDAGVAVRAGFDMDRRSVEAFNYNHAHRGGKGHLADLSRTSGAELLSLAEVGKVDLIVGGPPCQPFSIIGKQLGLSDKRGNLIFDFVRLVAEINPSAFVFENVPNLLAIDGGKLFGSVVSELRQLGYQVCHDILYAADYGVPQMRKRVFVVGVMTRGPLAFPPSPTHGAGAQPDLFVGVKSYVSSREAIGDLPDVDDERAREFHNHEPTIHSAAMLAAFAELKPGTRDKKSFHDRLHPDRLSYTLRAGTGNFSPLRPVHYNYDRVITVRESARLQGFGDDFIWPDWIPRLQQYRQVGNAVPPPFGKQLGEVLAAALGWQLDPDGLKGDAASRPPANLLTYEQRVDLRAKRLRGASLGLRVQAVDKLGAK